MENKKWVALYSLLVTPFCGEDEHVNYPALDKLIDFLIENGATGAIPCGSTGELVSMTLEEQLEINRHTIEYVNHRCKVYACTGAYRTSDAILLSKAAEEAGADGVMVVTPWYITPNEEEAYDHYKAIRAELSIPLILYHNPYLTGCWLSEKIIAKLYNDGIIDAIKDSAHDIYRHQNMRALCKDDGFLFSTAMTISPPKRSRCTPTAGSPVSERSSRQKLSVSMTSARPASRLKPETIS